MLYTGILEYISGGATDVNTRGGGYSFVRREFIQIGGKRLTGVRINTLHDELLKTALGKEVTLSVTNQASYGGLTVMAIKLPDGTIERIQAKPLVTTMVAGFFNAIVITLACAGILVAGIFLNIQLLTLLGIALGAIFWVVFLRQVIGVTRAQTEL